MGQIASLKNYYLENYIQALGTLRSALIRENTEGYQKNLPFQGINFCELQPHFKVTMGYYDLKLALLTKV